MNHFLILLYYSFLIALHPHVKVKTYLFPRKLSVLKEAEDPNKRYSIYTAADKLIVAKKKTKKKL